jgi:RNA polymerase sigma factor (sigma-70 family)
MAIDQKPAPSPPPQVLVKEASRERLDRLARRYYAPLVSFFRKRTRNTTEVHDLVQQVFLRLAQYRDSDTIRDPEGYLFQTASNTLKDHFRNTAVRDRYIRQQMESGDAPGSGISPERVLLGRENLSLLVEGLRRLPDRTRDIFMLRCIEGLKHAEIARLHGISVRAVEKHMVRALAHLNETVGYGAEE